MGFFALRHVEAESPEQAELQAVQMIRDEYREILGEKRPDDPNPTMHLEELLELDDFPEPISTKGASWFPMGS